MPDQPEPAALASDREDVLRGELAAQIERLRCHWPVWYDCIDLGLAAQAGLLDGAALPPADFESVAQGGRGELYRRAQQNPLVRAAGIQQLFALASPRHDPANLTSDHKILDVLGGDGLLTRAMLLLRPAAGMPHILTSDLSADMIAAALGHGLPAIRQPAQRLVVKDTCVDGVIVAYGTHHIPRGERPRACAEAFRVLRPAGAIVLHDFEEGSPAARWFDEVVDRYSLTGHRFPHFSAGEIRHYLQRAGFVDLRVEYLYDPFIVYGDTPEQARQGLAECLLHMYGLVKLVQTQGEAGALRAVYALAEEYFRYDYARMGLAASFGAPQIQLAEHGGRWRVEMPRVALVGSGVKPAGS